MAAPATIDPPLKVRPATPRPVAEAAPTPLPGAAMLELLEEWDAEDATDDPAELDRRDAEWLEFRQQMNASRAGGRTLFPEVCDPPAEDGNVGGGA